MPLAPKERKPYFHFNICEANENFLRTIIFSNAWRKQQECQTLVLVVVGYLFWLSIVGLTFNLESLDPVFLLFELPSWKFRNTNIIVSIPSKRWVWQFRPFNWNLNEWAISAVWTHFVESWMRVRERDREWDILEGKALRLIWVLSLS